MKEESDSSRTGEPQVWKMPVDGGEQVQVTPTGGFIAVESPDGRFLYCTIVSLGRYSVWKIPVEGGEEIQVLDSVKNVFSFAVVNEGIYFVPGSATPFSSAIHFHDFTTGVARQVATMERMEWFAVSPDGRSILYEQTDQSGADLMLVEDFR